MTQAALWHSRTPCQAKITSLAFTIGALAETASAVRYPVDTVSQISVFRQSRFSALKFVPDACYFSQ
jgi:hypothetical protein